MKTSDIRAMIFSTPLLEQAVSIPGWDNCNLIIRELDAHSGSALLASCSDAAGNVNQESLVAGIVLATLRNADDPHKSLIFAKNDDPHEYDPAYRDRLMSLGLGRVMGVATASIKLSGLDQAAGTIEAKNA